jgi:hypothetical protein
MRRWRGLRRGEWRRLREAPAVPAGRPAATAMLAERPNSKAQARRAGREGSRHERGSNSDVGLDSRSPSSPAARRWAAHAGMPIGDRYPTHSPDIRSNPHLLQLYGIMGRAA